MSGHRCGKWNNSGFLLPASLGGDVLKSGVSQKELSFAQGKMGSLSSRRGTFTSRRVGKQVFVQRARLTECWRPVRDQKR